MQISAAGSKSGLFPTHPRSSGFTLSRRSAEHGFTFSRRSAEHGFTPLRRSAEHGFTLVELMIVVTLIALASAAVAFALPDPRGRLDDDATRFAARARAAHDLAIIEGRSVSIWVAGGGYGFDRHDAGGWQAIADAPLRAATWQRGVRANVASPDGRDRVIFDSTGFANIPLDLELKRGDDRAHVRIGSDGSVRVGG